MLKLRNFDALSPSDFIQSGALSLVARVHFWESSIKSVNDRQCANEPRKEDTVKRSSKVLNYFNGLSFI